MSASVSPMSQHATLNQQGSLSSRNDAHMAELEGSPAGAYGHPMASTQGQSLPPIAVDPTLGFAEKVENPAPQVVFDNGAEVVREGIQPDATRDELPQAVLVVGEKVPCWRKKSTIIAICILGLLAITGLVLGVLGGTGVFSHKYEPPFSGLAVPLYYADLQETGTRLTPFSVRRPVLEWWPRPPVPHPLLAQL